MEPATKSLENIPTLKYGKVREFRSNRLGTLLRFNQEQGGIGRLKLLFGDIVIVNEPELVHEVLVAKARSFEKSPVMRSSLHPLAGQGLFTSEGELWRRQRKLMAPMFAAHGIGHFAADMTACAERAVTTWRDGSVVDVAREMTHITMAIAGKTLFAEDTFSEADDLGSALTTALEWVGAQASSLTLIAQARLQVVLERAVDRLPAFMTPLLRRVGERAMVPILWPGARTRALRGAIDVLDARVARMIAERRATPGVHRDLLSLLLDARGDDGAAMSDRQVRDEVLTLFVAGHETTATALAWSLMLLGQHPEWYDRVRAEVLALGRVPTLEDLPRLDVSLRVFKEALRMYPAVYMFGRVAIADVEIGGYALPKGTIVLLSPFAMHRRPQLWPEPNRFDPDRFLPEAEARRHRMTFLPFSAGPRTCIGNYFALMEGPLVLATLLHHVDLELTGPPTEPEPHATLRPKGSIPMRVRVRGRPTASEGAGASAGSLPPTGAP